VLTRKGPTDTEQEAGEVFPSPTATVRRAAALLLVLVTAVVAGAVPAQAGTKTPTVTMAVADARGAESGSLSFVVALSGASTRQISVHYATVDGTAVAGQDYAATAGDLVIPVGNTHGVVSVPVTADLRDERDETLTLQLSAPQGASLTDASGVGTIVDDDPVPAAQPTSPIVARGLAMGDARVLDPTRPFVTGSITPTPDALVVLQLAVAGPSVDLPAQVQGAGLRFDLLAEVRGYPDSPRAMGYYVAQGRATTGPVTLTWAPGTSPAGGLSYTVTQYSGVVVGANGRAVVAQIHFEPNHANGTSTQGFVDPLQSPRNAVVGFFMAGARSQDIIPEAGWTEVINLISGTSLFSLAATFATGGADLTPGASWQRESSNLWLAMELVARPA
jgi:Calx-beta domain